MINNYKAVKALGKALDKSEKKLIAAKTSNERILKRMSALNRQLFLKQQELQVATERINELEHQLGVSL